MTRFVPVPGLDEKVAWMVAPDVHRIAKKFERVAKRAAPAGKTWVHMGDALVRRTHREAGGHPMIPANTRFAVPGVPWDVEHGLSPGTDYLIKPKDLSTGLPPDAVQIIHCRCTVALHPNAIREQIKTGPWKVYGALVRVVVSCTAYRIVESEFGDTYPTVKGPLVDPGSRWMGRAVARFAGNGGARARPPFGAVAYTPPGGEDNL